MTNECCLSCDIANGVLTPVGGAVIRTTHFNAHHDFEYPVIGMIILASNRHIKCFDEMTDEEIQEFAMLVKKIRKAQRTGLNIEVVNYFYNEDTQHHFHLWMVPRYGWMDQFGKSVQSVRPALEYARKTFVSDEHKNALCNAIAAMRTAINEKL
ncbi:MAG: diadenosine tetraphosphate hydrolase [Alphaproteobacteria bacterium]|nr:diadenosine tetraphosphate hydrolase [Alphaproteobacteria bacterium]